jgi:hypothetical protein
MFDEEGAKIGMELRIRFPMIEHYARVSYQAHSAKVLAQLGASVEYLFVNGWEPPKQTRWQRFKAPLMDWPQRFKNAWLALKGHPIARDWE